MKSKQIEGFDRRLLKAINDRDLSCRQVCLMTGIGSNSMNGYVNEGQMPSCFNLVKLARLLSVSTDYLLGLEGE